MNLLQEWRELLVTSCLLTLLWRLLLGTWPRFRQFFIATQYYFGFMLASIWALLQGIGLEAHGITSWAVLASAILLQAWTLKKSWKLYTIWILLVVSAPLYYRLHHPLLEGLMGLAFLTFSLFRCRVDLEPRKQSFVLDTQKIVIPGHPNAYNGSLVRWQGRLVLSFRESAGKRRESRNSLIWLDEAFAPLGTPFPMPLPPEAEDIRLLAHQDRLFLVYTHAGDWMSKAELTFDGQQFSLSSHQELRQFDGKAIGKMEKNWTPFIINNQFQWLYSIKPNRILSAEGKTVYQTENRITWPWGEIRGGTPAIQVNPSSYLAFFHSQKMMPSKHSLGIPTLHYFVGAYTFSAEPPHEILKISPEPIIGPGFYRRANHHHLQRTPVNVVYPCGLVLDESHLWISYGRQDHEVWIAKLDRQAVLESLKRVDTII